MTWGDMAGFLSQATADAVDGDPVKQVVKGRWTPRASGGETAGEVRVAGCAAATANGVAAYKGRR